MDVLISEEKSRASSIFEELCDSLKFNVRVVEGRGVNPGGSRPPEFAQGGRGRVVKYYYILSCTGSMLESGDF